MDKMDFMNMVKDILEETENEELQAMGEEMKQIIDSLVKMEVGYYIAGLR